MFNVLNLLRILLWTSASPQNVSDHLQRQSRATQLLYSHQSTSRFLLKAAAVELWSEPCLTQLSVAQRGSSSGWAGHVFAAGGTVSVTHSLGCAGLFSHLRTGTGRALFQGAADPMRRRLSLFIATATDWAEPRSQSPLYKRPWRVKAWSSNTTSTANCSTLQINSVCVSSDCVIHRLELHSHLQYITGWICANSRGELRHNNQQKSLRGRPTATNSLNLSLKYVERGLDLLLNTVQLPRRSTCAAVSLDSPSSDIYRVRLYVFHSFKLWTWVWKHTVHGTVYRRSCSFTHSAVAAPDGHIQVLFLSQRMRGTQSSHCHLLYTHHQHTHTAPRWRWLQLLVWAPQPFTHELHAAD